ncbi:MAG: hypothetical protein ACFFE8_13065 [Candidatus Heimdallarchaeota archaeon]
MNQRIKALQESIEDVASRTTELNQKLENRSVEFRSNTSKEFKQALDDAQLNLEKFSLELNNQILELSDRVETISRNSANWSFAVNEQIEEFRKQYVDVLEDLRQAKHIAVEKEKILTDKYEALVQQLKEKESISLEKETFSQKQIENLQGEIDQRKLELERVRARLAELQPLFQEKTELEQKAAALESEVGRLREENEMQKYELERTKTQIKTLNEETSRDYASSKVLKRFLGESESGRVLNQLLNMEETSIDDIAAMTGISTYNVQQVVHRFRDMGIAHYDDGTRRVRLID